MASDNSNLALSSTKEIQQFLKDNGFDPGGIDGYMGSQTIEAIKSFQSAAGLAADGDAGPKTIESMRAWDSCSFEVSETVTTTTVPSTTTTTTVPSTTTTTTVPSTTTTTTVSVVNDYGYLTYIDPVNNSIKTFISKGVSPTTSFCSIESISQEYNLSLIHI